MAGLAGIEPTTRGLENRCSIRMSYRPNIFQRFFDLRGNFGVNHTIYYYRHFLHFKADYSTFKTQQSTGPRGDSEPRARDLICKRPADYTTSVEIKPEVRGL